MSSIKELKSDKIKFKNDPSRCVEITNLLGSKYRDCGRYSEAIDEHLEAIKICKLIKNQQNNLQLEALSRRALGECYSEIGKHSEALEQHQIYLSLASKLSDLIEVQRANATLGRTYLLWAQDDQLTDSNKNYNNFELLKKSKNSFEKALELCENLKFLGKLKPKEYAEMKSRLLLNLGLVYENFQNFDKCKELIENSITLTKANFLLDELFRCQISMGSIMEKTDCYKEAIYYYDEALKTATTLKSKRKKFDSYICLALIYMKQELLDRCKSYFKKAYFLKIPLEEDQERIEQLLKITFAIEDDLKKLLKINNDIHNNDDDNLEKKIELCDRLGDHFVLLKCFQLAIKYYKKELNFSTEANKSDSFKSKIYVSIGQTYLDDGQFLKAIEYFKHEYNFQLGNIHEQCRSLMKIADIQECLLNRMDDKDLDQLESNKLKNEIVKNYETSLKLLNFNNLNESDKKQKKNLKLFKDILKNYLSYLESNNLDKFRQQQLRNDLESLNYEDNNGDEEDIVEEMDEDDTNQIYDQYKLDDLLSNPSDNDDLDENDEEIPENFHSRPKRNPTTSIARNRLNQFGETPLHVACISGNLQQVQKLLDQKRLNNNFLDINAKDFCGWTPLHEACNHGYLEIVELLLKNGANIEAYDEKNDRIRPLHDACNCGHFDIIKLLLNYNANVLALNKNNETPLECLISWRERSKMELDQKDLEECLELEQKLMNLMKEKGFDLSQLFKKSKTKSSSIVNTDNNNIIDRTTKKHQINPIRKQRNLVKDLIYSSENFQQQKQKQQSFASDDVSENQINNVIDIDEDEDDDSAANLARNEYCNTIESLRHFGLTKSKNQQQQCTSSTSRQKQNALVNEDEEAPRDDWLIDDLQHQQNNNNKKTRKRYASNNEYLCTNYNRNVSGGLGRGCNKKLKSSNKNHLNYPHHHIDADDNDDDFSIIDTEIIGDNYNNDNNGSIDLENGLPSRNIATSASSAVNVPKPLSSSATTAATNNRFNNQMNEINAKKALTINFDDQNQSSFIVFIDKKSDCKWLKEELTRRYFTHYGMKPLFSLKTQNNAILLDSDPVWDITMNNELTIKACIDSWILDQPDKRFLELCQLENLKDYDKNIENCLRKCSKNSYLNFSGVYFPSPIQCKLIFKSILRQGIKELDFSDTNLLMTKENYNSFRSMIISLPNLEQLNLRNVSFPSSCLIHLLNLSLSLKKLDLSFNSFGSNSIGNGDNDCNTINYSIAQIIITFRKLDFFNLSGCDLGPKFIQSTLLKNSIENSTLTTLLLEQNDFPEDLINKFKSLDLNRSLLF